MITQKPISLKIDAHLLEELDQEVSLGWRKRNALINEAIRTYLVLADSRRRIKSYGSLSDQVRELERLVKELLPGTIYLDAVEKYILSGGSGESLYDQVTIESCNTDCVHYRQGTCPYRLHEKVLCTRFKVLYNSMLQGNSKEGSGY